MGNSYAERVIGTVTSQLRTCVEHTHLEWDDLLDTVMSAYRATPHSATGFSPNMVMLGREVRLPAVLCPPGDNIPVTDYVRKLNEKIKYVYSKCLGAPNIQMEGYDHLIHTPLKVGDRVLVKKINPSKMETKFSGPHSIIKVLDFDTYVLSEKGKEVIEHHSRLKLYSPNPTEVEPDLGDFMSQHGMDQSDDDLILDPDDLGDDFMTTTTTQDRYTYDNMVSPKPIIQPDGSDDSIPPDLGQNNTFLNHTIIVTLMGLL